MDSTSYSVGMMIAKNLKAEGITQLDQASFQKAMQDVFQGKETAMTDAEAATLFQSYTQKAKMKAGEQVRIAGEEFLKANGAKKEVVTTASGLQYEVLESSDSGQKPTLTDKVKVHYHGTLIDGTVFDSSVDRGEPISFPVNGVIQGWQEGLQLMAVGSKFRFYIPYDLAYGERAAGPTIKPFSALVFDVTLLGIE